MSDYIYRNGILYSEDELRHAKGWTKPGAKYVKKVPKPGGGFWYVYPQDLKKKAQNTIDNVSESIQKTAKKAGKAMQKVNKGFKKNMVKVPAYKVTGRIGESGYYYASRKGSKDVVGQTILKARNTAKYAADAVKWKVKEKQAQKRLRDGIKTLKTIGSTPLIPKPGKGKKNGLWDKKTRGKLVKALRKQDNRDLKRFKKRVKKLAKKFKR